MSMPESKIRLFVFGTGWGIPFPTSGPFPLKLCTWMRMAKIPHELVVENDPRKGPKGKSPWIEYDGTTTGDSSIIIAYLTERFGVDLDSHLSVDERARALMIQRTLEEHYHQAYEHQLFLGRGGAERLREFTSTLPPVLRFIVPRVLVKQLRGQLHARGIGRHAESEIIRQGKADLDALSHLLGDRPYFLGDRPSSIDACIFGFLGVSVYVNGDNALFTHAASLHNLKSYCERMRAMYFAETVPGGKLSDRVLSLSVS
ncbi:MAG TPA: glutathione S-transferase C-terminal domain-containing protein [Polyangiaceae bacterium]|nr:glutathione S-transferase C-terminal domain-containing protein [Polyangiaceae bacterium]